MNTVRRTAIMIFFITSIPLAIAFYRFTPHPTYVEHAERSLTSEQQLTHETTNSHAEKVKIASERLDNPQEQTAATILTLLPVMYSISAACVLSWCLVLILGCLAAHQTMRFAKRSRKFNSHQTVLFNGVIILTVTNICVLILGNSILHSLMDSIVMWNLGMIVVLVYLSICLRQTNIFDCLVRQNLMKARASRIARLHHDKINSSETEDDS